MSTVQVPANRANFFVVGYRPNGVSLVLASAVDRADADTVCERLQACQGYERIVVEPARGAKEGAA